jgi:hypothetical protein
LTNVTATLTSTTPGVALLDATASLPTIPATLARDSVAPHLTVLLPTSLACGELVSFELTVASDQGSWIASFTHGVGQSVPVQGAALNESFAAGIPATWIVVNGGVGGGAAQTWTTANPGSRPIAAPMSAPTAIVDSDFAGPDPIQDEQLITPALDLTAAATVTLRFDQYFNRFSGGPAEAGDVDVRSSATSGGWINVLRQETASSPNPDHQSINLDTLASGASNVQVRFHYFNAQYDFYWQVDNVKVDTTQPGACTQVVCAAAPNAAKPVADGSFGTPMSASRGNAAGSAIQLTWDVATCSSTDHHVLYGPLAAVATATVSGASCNLGGLASATWTGVPAGNLWFVVVGDDDAATEGSWGMTSAGQRGGTTPSGRCGLTTRNNGATCP